MVTAPTRIDFTEPERMHASGDTITTFEIAERLERKYNVVRAFIMLHKTDVERIISKELAIGIKRNRTNE